MTQERRLFASVAVALAIALSGTGCSTLVACAGPMIPTPAVWLDGSPWLVAHPGHSLRACFSNECQDVSAQQPLVQIMQGNTQLGQSELLTVTVSGRDAQQLISRHVALKAETEHGGACGDTTSWGLNARVTADGHVEILGWGGPMLRPATTVPIPSSSPTP